MTRYRCYYQRPTTYGDGKIKHHRVALVDDNPGIEGQVLQGAFLNGFWVNDDGLLVGEDQGQYWIPPSAILMLERYQEPDPDGPIKFNKIPGEY